MATQQVAQKDCTYYLTDSVPSLVVHVVGWLAPRHSRLQTPMHLDISLSLALNLNPKSLHINPGMKISTNGIRYSFAARLMATLYCKKPRLSIIQFIAISFSSWPRSDMPSPPRLCHPSLFICHRSYPHSLPPASLPPKLHCKSNGMHIVPPAPRPLLSPHSPLSPDTYAPLKYPPPPHPFGAPITGTTPPPPLSFSLNLSLFPSLLLSFLFSILSANPFRPTNCTGYPSLGIVLPRISSDACSGWMNS